MNRTLHTIQEALKRNSPFILSGTAITGVVTTAYLASKASVRAHKKLEAFRDLEVDLHREFPEAYSSMRRRDRLVRDTKQCWRLYVPTMASGTVTIGCILLNNRVAGARVAAAQAAFVISERAYSEYRDKVIEEYGERKDEMLRASVAQDRVNANPPSGTVVIGTGRVLCCEQETGRYFECDMESLRRAENDINARLLHHDSATLDDWYDLIGMPPTANSADRGWNSDKLLHIEFTSVLTPDGRPCLAFTYNYTRPLYEGLFG